MNPFNKTLYGASKYFFISIIYFIGIFILFLLLLKYLNSANIWNKLSFLNWDAAHYNHIAHIDYVGFRNTFFPLFPLTWKFLSLSAIGIVIFNGLIFIVSLSFLMYSLQINPKVFLLMLSFPSLIFVFLPYSESLFFAASVIVLVGINNRSYVMIFIGLFLATLTRPVACLFIPVSLMFLFMNRSMFQDTKKIMYYILPVLIGMASVVVIQYCYTGDWFAFSHAEAAWGWGGNSFRLPKFHLTSWGGDNIARLDGSALLIGMIATIALGYFVLKKSPSLECLKNESVLFSTLYLAGICWFVLFTRGGSLFSLNRFVFATPFFFVALSAFLKKTWTTKEYLLIFFLLNAFWLLFGSYVHIQAFLAYFSLSIFLMLFLFISHHNKYLSRIAYSVCLICNVFLQLYFYHSFLSGGWVG